MPRKKQSEQPEVNPSTPQAIAPQPGDLFVGSRKRQWGWMRSKVNDVAFLFQQKLTPSELREIADWANKVADYIESTEIKN